MIGVVINKIIDKLGYRIVKTIPVVVSKNKSYIDCEDTVTKANEQNLSVSEYVEKSWNQVGATQKVIENISRITGTINIKNVLEIGPGTGRYLEKIKHIYSPSNYVIYEIDEAWSQWLGKKYNVTVRNSDGRTLSYDKDSELDFVHAHGVFTYLPFLNSFEYFKEMIRVCKKNGTITFDFYSAELFDNNEIKKWLGTAERYPVPVSAQTIKKYFADLGAAFLGEFENPYGHGFSTYHVYRKNEC